MVKKIYDSVAIAEVYTGESIIPEDCTELCAQANQLRRGILQALRNFEDKHRVAEPYLYIKTPEIDVDSAQPDRKSVV